MTDNLPVRRTRLPDRQFIAPRILVDTYAVGESLEIADSPNARLRNAELFNTPLTRRNRPPGPRNERNGWNVFGSISPVSGACHGPSLSVHCRQRASIASANDRRTESTFPSGLNRERPRIILVNESANTNTGGPGFFANGFLARSRIIHLSVDWGARRALCVGFRSPCSAGATPGRHRVGYLCEIKSQWRRFAGLHGMLRA